MAALLLAVAWQVTAPLPIAAVSAVAGGLISFWLSSRRRWIFAAGGMVAGATAGAAVHASQHLAEDRMSPPGGLASHLAGDAGLGLLIAGLVLVVVLGAAASLRAKRSSTGAGGS